jgi:uncharacterized protein YpiB (UPF0302 family)
MTSHLTVGQLKREYELAVKEGRDGFILNGHQFFTGYAKYLLEYLIGIKKMKLNQRIIFTEQQENHPNFPGGG